jgi:hypothetical protein
MTGVLVLICGNVALGSRYIGCVCARNRSGRRPHMHAKANGGSPRIYAGEFGSKGIAANLER